MIFQGAAWHGRAWPGLAGQHVTQYGNWDNFLKARIGAVRIGLAGQGAAWRGEAWRGGARQYACRCAVTPDTFVGNNQGNQSKTT